MLSPRPSTRCGHCSHPKASCAVCSLRPGSSHTPVATSSRPSSWTHCTPRTRAEWDGARRMSLSSTRPTCCSGRFQRGGAPDGRARGSTMWPTGSSRSACPTARAADARSSTCRARRRAATGWTAGSARRGSRRPHSWVTLPRTSCTACTRNSPTASRWTTHRWCARPTPGTATSWSTRPRTSRRCSGGRSPGGARPSRSRSPVTRRRRSAPVRRPLGIASSRHSTSTRVP